MTEDSSSQDRVVIERSFDAPAALIWQMWTEPRHFAAWYGPNGATIPVANMDVRIGGTRLVCMEMRTPNGPMQMWFTGEYREVIVNERLVYTESMADANGQVLSPEDAQRPEGHPTTTEITVELEEFGGPYQNGGDPRGHSRRFSRRGGMEHGIRQARCLSRDEQSESAYLKWGMTVSAKRLAATLVSRPKNSMRNIVQPRSMCFWI